jgi:4-amino-4-deoxy-L-arabinose transferase-like glycosyltransferase
MPRKIILVSLSILFLAALLRLMMPDAFPVFADEAIYIRWSQVMRAEPGLRFLPLSDGKQPLFMWAVIPMLKVFTDPLLAGRILSALCGLATAAGTGVAAFILFKNTRIALSSAALLAVVPYAVFFDRLALADGMLTMFVVWTFVFSLLAFRYCRWDFSMLAGFSLGFAWLTKSPAVFSFILVPTLLLLVYKDRSEIKTRLPVHIGLLLTTYIIAFAMYNILRLGPEFQMIAIRNRDYVFSLADVLKHPADPLIPHLRDALDFFSRLLTPLGLVFALLGIFEGMAKHWRQRTVLIFWWLGPVIVQSFVAKSFTARYLLFTIPFGLILASHGIWHFGDRTRRHFLSLVGFFLVVLLSLGFDYLLLFDPQAAPLPRIERSGYLEEWTAGTGIKEVAEYIKNLPGNPPVVIGSEGYFGTPFSALQMYLNGLPNVRVVGVGLGIDRISPDLTNALKDNQVYLVVNAGRFSGDAGALGLQLLASYPKAARPDNSRDYLLFFRLSE